MAGEAPRTSVEYVTKTERFGDEEIGVVYYRSKPLDAPLETQLPGCGIYPPLDPHTYVANGVRCDQDTSVELRDGVTIYVDVFRPDGPAGEADLPAILSWSYYGKRSNLPGHDNVTLGVPAGTLSNACMFEGPDPEYWCKQGYAVINVDGRGVGHSGGDFSWFGKQDGQDGYDAVEWAAAQPWSNGKVSMYGNSSLAMSQWWVAAEQPPHLACIAPWEGGTDQYREYMTDNGIPAIAFNRFIWSIFRGQGLIIDRVAMAERYPLMNAYWESLIPDFKKVVAPCYMTTGWNHIHNRGAVNAWMNIGSEAKWLRAHRDFEWPDGYTWWHLEDLKRFFDRYLKGVRNGWESTPPVRADVMDAYDHDFQVARPEREFPLARTQYQKLYLDGANGALAAQPAAARSRATYDAAEGRTTFDIEFEEDVELTGYVSAHLWVEADGSDEMDLFLTIMKMDENGEWLPTNVMGQPHPGQSGKLRVSQRALDPELSTDFQPVQAHRAQEKLRSGEIVPVDIAIYPFSRIWHKGQKLRLQIAGRYFREGWFEPFTWELENRGTHIIHTGGEYDSYLQIPVVPPKYRAGEYVYR
jgi:predicted acyl esterase